MLTYLLSEDAGVWGRTAFTGQPDGGINQLGVMGKITHYVVIASGV